ncbi:hypothetical protein DFP82_10493 [Psychrobacter fozii]|uniref:Uncharacterized protein n=1 Tax=Psychrobacter fozii TaxID=198480 RepID=A0A2V4V0B8_9GAMM|nr:hypothetical protein DFP82_10493 [Psychrobacter fozii]
MYKNIDEPIKVEVSIALVLLGFINNYAIVLYHCKVNKFSSDVSSSERKRAA